MVAAGGGMGSSLSSSSAAAAESGSQKVFIIRRPSSLRSFERGERSLLFGRFEVDRNLKSEFVFDDNDVNSKLKTF